MVGYEWKWTNSPVQISVVESLKAKSEMLREQYAGKKDRYAIFSKSGFNGTLPNSAKNVIFMELSDIGRELCKKQEN